VTEWEKFGFDEAAAVQWRAAGFVPRQAFQWREYGFDLTAAAQWRAAGFAPGEAHAERREGRTVAEARAYHWPRLYKEVHND
jgi:hypothetical protein